MHTRIEIVITGLDEEKGRSLGEAIETEIKALERLFNRFNERSPLAAMNLRAAQEAIEVDNDMFMALELCEAFRRGTRGYFNIATSSVTAGELSYKLDAKNHTVKYTNSDISLDMGGFAKGFALERVKRMVTEAGAETALLNFGNSSVAALRHHPYGEWWGIGVENNRKAGVLAKEIHLRDSAMSVSGRAWNGKYHIVNPRTGSLVAGDELVVVEGKSALVAEVLSTALYAAPRAERGLIMRDYEGYKATELYCGGDGSCQEVEIK